MTVLRIIVAAMACIWAFAPAPASAQFFFKSPDLSGPPVTGAEPGIAGQALPDATPEELRAALVWNLRAALNVAALQCQFEPTLLTRENYNAMLLDHKDELKKSYETLAEYFRRTHETAKEGQTAFDQFSTRVYAGFSTVSAQHIFCQTADKVSHEAVFAPRGTLVNVAITYLRELRNSTVPWGEQQFPGSVYIAPARPLPWRFNDPKCWDDGEWRTRRCGEFRI